MTIKPVYPPSGSVNKCHAYNHVPVPGRPPNVTYVCRACVCVCRSPSPFSACVHHPSVRTLAYTYHSSRLGACVCVCRSPSPFSACVHHPSVRTLAYTYHSSHRFSACVHRSPVHACAYAGRPPRLRARIMCVYQLRVSLSVHAHIVRACVCTCVHRPCAHVCAHSRRHRISACVCTVLCVCVRNTMFLQCFREAARMQLHARRRAKQPSMIKVLVPSVFLQLLTTHISPVVAFRLGCKLQPRIPRIM